jgi:outer membrane immunogenic protein
MALGQRLLGRRNRWLAGASLPALIAALVSGSAAAAEPAPAAFDWTGLYVGGQFGYGGFQSDGFFATSVDMGLGPGFFLTGGRVGWNWQHDNWVLGIEHDASWFSAEDTNLREEHYIGNGDFLATLRARVGWADDNVLFFLTGGAAYLHAGVTTSEGGLDPDQQDNTDSKDVSAFGGVAGAGIEWALTRNLSLTAEGLYFVFHKRTTLSDLEEGLPAGPFPDEGIPAGVSDNFFAISDGFMFRLAVNWRLWNPNASAAEAEALAYNPFESDVRYDWSGFYVGAHWGFGMIDAGGVYRNDRFTNPPPPDPSNPAPIDLSSLRNEGVLGGLQAGYNWQFGSLVLGLEADITGLDWQSAITDVQTPWQPQALALDIDLLATARARAGLSTDTLLFYVTGGLAVLKGTFKDLSFPDNAEVSALGAVVGGGLEWAFAPNLSFKAEGLYLMFDETVGLSGLSGKGVVGDHLDIDDGFVLRLGANWHPGRPASYDEGEEEGLALGPTDGAYDWRGIYAGAHLGWGGLNTEGIYNPRPLPNLTIDLTNIANLGFLGGAGAGFNWQAGSLVFGIEGDVAAVGWDGSAAEFYNPSDRMDFDASLLATIRARAGYADDNLLLYVTAGVAYLDARLDNTANLDDADNPGKAADISAFGGVAGLGLEWGITHNLSAKAEGLYLFFDEDSYIKDLGGEGNKGDFFRLDDGFIFRVGVNWRFNPFAAETMEEAIVGLGPSKGGASRFWRQGPLAARAITIRQPEEMIEEPGPPWVLSGIANRAILVWDDNDRLHVNSVDNQQDSSGFELDGQFELGGGWRAGLTVALDTYFAASDTVNQLDWVGDGAVIELPYLFAQVGNDRYGTIAVGLNDSATDEIDNINLAGADAVADASFENFIDDFYLRAKGKHGDGGLASGKHYAFNAGNGAYFWGDFLDGKLASESGRFINYYSPVWNGLEFSAAVGQPQEIFLLKTEEPAFNEKVNGVYWDAALRYEGEWGGLFQVKAGVGYWRDTTEEKGAVEETDDEGIGGSLAIRHVPTGLNLAVNYATASHSNDCAEPGLVTGECPGRDEFVYVKGGIVRDFIDWGRTAIYGEFYREWKHPHDSDEDLVTTLWIDDDPPEPLELTESVVTGWGMGVVQRFDAIGTDVYLGLRHYSIDFDLVDAAGPVKGRKFEDMITAVAGLTIHWGGAGDDDD